MYHPLQAQQHFQPPPQYKYPQQQHIANGVQYLAQTPNLHPAPSPAPQTAAPFANVIIESTNKIEKNIGGQLWTCYYDNSTNNRKQKYVITTNIPKYCFSKASLYITYDDEKDLKQETFMFSISSFVFTQKISKVTAEGAEYVFVAEHDNTATFKRKSGKGNTCSIYVVFDTTPSTILLGAFGLLLFSKESVAENFLKKKQIEITNQQRKLQMNTMMQPQQNPQSQAYTQQPLVQPVVQHPQAATKIQIVQQMQPQQILHYHSPQQYSPQHPISPPQHPVNPENPSPVMSPISQPQQPTQPQSPPHLHQFTSGYPSPQQISQPALQLSAQSPQMQPSQVSGAIQSQLLQQQAAQQLAALIQSQHSHLTVPQSAPKTNSSAPNPITKSTKQRKKFKKLHTTTKVAPTVATVTDEFTDFLADMQGMDLLTHFESFVNNYNYAVDTAINIGTWAQPSELLSTKGSSMARPSHVTEEDQERISSFLSRFYSDEFSPEEHNMVIQEGDQLVFNLSNTEKNGNSIVIVGVEVTYSILRYTPDGEEELVTYENQVLVKGDTQKPEVDSNISILPVGHTAKMSIPVDSNILEAAKSILDSDDPQEEQPTAENQDITYSPVAVMSVCFNFVKYQDSKAVKKVVNYIVEPTV